jgi:mannose-6-phosphate isomerase-like protein (cupin superfamily)
MIKHVQYGLASIAAICLGGMAAAQSDTADILDRFATDYLTDTTFSESVTFGVEVDGDMWTVAMDHPGSSFEITHDTPPVPTFYFTVEAETLGKIDRTEMTALTAMGKAFSTDVTPMDIELMDGASFDPFILGVTFHFWTRGTPEVLNFRDLETRYIHGGNAALIYYQPGFRSGFGYLMPGQHANADEASRTNPFPSMFIFTGGRAIARIDGVDQEVSDGQILFIPPGMSHEFLNPFDEPAEFLLFMFGEGA